MKQPLWRRLPLLLIIVLALLRFGAAHENKQTQSGLDHITEQEQDNGQYWVDDDGKQRDWEYRQEQAQEQEQGQEQDKDVPNPSGRSAFHVEEALGILSRIRPTESRLARLTKPTGFVGKTAYYAKELFVLLFLNAPPQADLLSSGSQPQKLSAPLSKAVALLQDAAVDDNPDAIWLLAEMNFYGNFSHPRDYHHAFERYSQLADLNGNSSAQYMLGFMFATGIGGAVEQDQARAMLYHVFAAEGGDIRSQMTLAYRHHTGIGAARDCDEAVHYYKQVADKAVAFYKSGPPGGHSLVKNAYRLADEDGGVYGEGASVSSSGANAKTGGPTSDAYADLDDVLEFLDFQSRKGDLRATFNLGKLYYDGSRGLPRNPRAAKDHFMQVARLYWTPQGKVKTDLAPGVDKLAPKAAGHIGRMFLRGEGMDQSYAKAKIWFQRGIANGDALCQYSMGVMYLHGLGVPKDTIKAAEYFAPAADQDLAVAQTHLGVLFLDQGDLQTARNYFELAARNSHIEAFYYLAEISNQGLGRDRSCGMAAVYYKITSEKAEIIHSPFIEANDAYDKGDLETALVAYMMAAEQGYEHAQANVAYLLDHTRPRFSLPSLFPFLRRKVNAINDAALALIYWTRSSKQSNIDSLVKMGDYYLDGLGTVVSPDNAAACYQAAAETMQSAQAMWNLGWMHENGVGIEQDFHLAKRFYDQALETNAEAYLPVKLSLTRLRIRSWWNGVSGGKVNSIRDDEAPKKTRSLSQWLNDFLEADAAYYADQYEADDWDHSHSDHIPGDDDDFVEFYEIDLLEIIVIVGLVGALAFLVCYRQYRQMIARRRQAQQQGDAVGANPDQQPQQQQQNERGFFPQPGEPEFANWVAGGIGH